MRKFALLPLFLGLSLAQFSFGQVRDLFAEFEEEASAKTPATAPASSAAKAVVPASSAAKEVAPASSAVAPAPVSSSAKAPASSASKKSKVKSSSSKAVSSSSKVVEVSSSSVVVLSSSSAVVSSAVESSSSVAPAESSSSIGVVLSSSAVAPDVAVADTSVLDSATRDSLMREAAIAEAEKVRARADSSRRADSLAQALAAGLANSSSSAVVVGSSNSMSRRDLLGPVKVSKVHGIDEMKGRYKNPRKALFLSLLVPGAGQIYVGGSTATYVRGGVYLALEVFMWSGWGYFSIHKYNEQVKKYKKFAKEHYSIGRYEREMRDLYNTDADLYGSEFNNRYMGTRKSFCEAIYGSATYGGCYHENSLFADDPPQHANNFVDVYDRNKKITLGEEIKNVKGFDNESEVFQLISEGSYVLGWDDAEAAVASSLNLSDPNSETVPLGESERLKKYRSMRSDANSYADTQVLFIGGLILNHIISAIDAAFTANAHNKVLYEEDVSWYDHLHFDSGMSFTDSFGWTVRANWGF